MFTQDLFQFHLTMLPVKILVTRPPNTQYFKIIIRITAYNTSTFVERVASIVIPHDDELYVYLDSSKVHCSNIRSFFSGIHSVVRINPHDLTFAEHGENNSNIFFILFFMASRATQSVNLQYRKEILF